MHIEKLRNVYFVCKYLKCCRLKNQYQGNLEIQNGDRAPPSARTITYLLSKFMYFGSLWPYFWTNKYRMEAKKTASSSKIFFVRRLGPMNVSPTGIIFHVTLSHSQHFQVPSHNPHKMPLLGVSTTSNVSCSRNDLK